MKILAVVLFAILAVFPVVCRAQNTDPRTAGFTLKVETVGNHSFIALKFVGNPGDEANRKIILKVVDEFEKQNPGLTVLSWKFSYSLMRGEIMGVAGIWIDHIPKKGCCR